MAVGAKGEGTANERETCACMDTRVSVIEERHMPTGVFMRERERERHTHKHHSLDELLRCCHAILECSISEM